MSFVLEAWCEQRQHSIYKWKAKYGGIDVSEAKRLKALEDENGR